MEAKEAAIVFGEGGRLSYEKDGEVTPVLIMMGEGHNGIVMHPHPKLGERPPDAYAEIVWKLGKVYPWHTIVTVSEAWTRSFPKEESEVADRLRKGDLSRMAEAGDPTVRTCVMTAAMDLKRPSHSYSVHSTVLNEPHKPVEWDVYESEGQLEGDMPDMLMRAYMESLAPPDSMMMPPLSLIIDVLIAADLVLAADLIAPDWPPSRN